MWLKRAIAPMHLVSPIMKSHRIELDKGYHMRCMAFGCNLL